MKFIACRTADWKNAIPKANNAQCQIEAERIKDEQLQRTRKEHGYNNCIVNSQAPDVPEMAHLGIFKLSRLSVNCYVKTKKKIGKVVNNLLMTSRTIKTTFLITYQILFQFLLGLKAAFDEDRYLFGVLGNCENVREKFEEI